MEEMIRKFFGGKDHLIRRYLIFLAGLTVCSLGVAITTKAALGTSPVAAIPYSISLAFPSFTFGQWLIAFSLVQIAVQIVLLRRKCIPSELLIQAILSFAYGYLTDFSVALVSTVQLPTYFHEFAFLIGGCFVLALGVYLELVGDVAMLPGDAFNRAVAYVLHQQYDKVKITVDVSMTAISAVLCLVTMGKLNGVREGTIVAAFLVGYIIRVYHGLFTHWEQVVLPKKAYQ